MLCTFHLYNSPQLWNGVTVQFSRCGILLRQTIVSLQLRVCVQVFSSTTTTQGEQCVASGHPLVYGGDWTSTNLIMVLALLPLLFSVVSDSAGELLSQWSFTRGY